MLGALFLNKLHNTDADFDVEGVDIDIAHLQKVIKADVAAIVDRLNDSIIHPRSTSVANLSDIIGIQEDLDRIKHNINLCTRQGSEWGSETYGCTAKQIASWRVDWPKQINALSWQSYFRTWTQEKDKFASD